MSKTSKDILNTQNQPDSSFQEQFRSIRNEYILPDCVHNDGRRHAAMISGRGQELDRQLRRKLPSFNLTKKTSTTEKATTPPRDRKLIMAELAPAAGALAALWIACSRTPEMGQVIHGLMKLLGQ